MEIYRYIQAKNISVGKNKCKYILVHHTGGSAASDIPLLTGEKVREIKKIVNGKEKIVKHPVSVHYYVDVEGRIRQFAKDEQITRHAGETNHDCKNPNSIGIEVESDGKKYNNKQRSACLLLIKTLMERRGVTVDRVLRHADVSGYRGKRDIGPNFYNYKFQNMQEFIEQNPYNKTEEKLLQATIKFFQKMYKKDEVNQHKYAEMASKLREIGVMYDIDTPDKQ